MIIKYEIINVQIKAKNKETGEEVVWNPDFITFYGCTDVDSSNANSINGIYIADDILQRVDEIDLGYSIGRAEAFTLHYPEKIKDEFENQLNKCRKIKSNKI